MKYIFVAGAPGSKWSSVVKNIYYSPTLDQTDYSDARTYWHDASGKNELMHLGAYFDPGMEFGDFFNHLEYFNKKQCEEEFDKPFNGKGKVRIIKSHIFCHRIDFLRKYWPDCPIVLDHRPDDACLGWWVKCGHFNITYPTYKKYYKDLREMGFHIQNQNKDLLTAWNNNEGLEPKTNVELASMLKLDNVPPEYYQSYELSDVRVKVLPSLV